ncbi:hypothetical protein HK405_014841, partial [Cladochytrium tenue]
MATLEDLRDTFDKFCAFGSTRSLSSSNSTLAASTSSLSLASMDGTRFAKFARDSGLVDGRKITATDIDLVFNKVKSKSSR